MGHRREFAERIWGKGRHSPPLATLENIWDIDSSDPTHPQEVRQTIMVVLPYEI